MDWLPGINADRLRIKVEKHIKHAAKEHDEDIAQISSGNEENTTADTESIEDQLFQELYDKPSQVQAQEVLIKKYLEQAPNKSFEKDHFPNKFLKDLFLRYNTPIPSSAAVERLFSMGKDILRPKRCRMSDRHFEMLVFLRSNKS